MVQSVMVLHLHNVVELQLLLESFTRSDFIFAVLLLLSIVYQKIADRRVNCLTLGAASPKGGGPHRMCRILWQR